MRVKSMDGDSSKRLERSIGELFLKIGGRRHPPLAEMSPGCPFGALLEERLRNMEREIGELKGRINGLIFLLIALVLAEILMRLI
jgi:hypothetical protein